MAMTFIKKTISTTLARLLLLKLALLVLALGGGGCARAQANADMIKLARDTDVQEQVREWVVRNIVDNPRLESDVEFFSAGGIGLYLVKKDFDWGIFGMAREAEGQVKLLGEPEAPLGVSFTTAGRCSIIYRITPVDLTKSGLGIVEEELEQISSDFFVFCADR